MDVFSTLDTLVVGAWVACFVVFVAFLTWCSRP